MEPLVRCFPETQATAANLINPLDFYSQNKSDMMKSEKVGEGLEE